MPHPSQAATASPPAKKPRGNPNLALVPRCGARTRSGCPCLAPAIHGKLRCRMHGGRSTGPSPAGRDRIRAARTIHGNNNAEARALNRYRLTLLRRNRVTRAAMDYLHHLPPVFVARLYGHAPELNPPPKPTGGITAAADRMRRRAVAAALAPWQQAIADARAAHLAARAVARAAKPHTPVRPRPPRDAGAPKPHAPIPGPAEPAATTRANRLPEAPAAPAPAHAGPACRPTPPRPSGQTPPVTAAPKPHAPDRASAPNDTGGSKPHAPIPGSEKPAATTRASRPPEAPAMASPANATPGHRPTPPRPAGQNPPVTAARKPPAPDGAPAPAGTGGSKPLAPIPGSEEPAIPPDLPNRAARRRWKSLQRRKHRDSAPCALPTSRD